MAHLVEFLKSTTINGVKYETGKKLNVSTSIYKRLISGKLAKDFEEKVEKVGNDTVDGTAEKPKSGRKKSTKPSKE